MPRIARLKVPEENEKKSYKYRQEQWALKRRLLRDAVKSNAQIKMNVDSDSDQSKTTSSSASTQASRSFVRSTRKPRNSVENQGDILDLLEARIGKLESYLEKVATELLELKTSVESDSGKGPESESSKVPKSESDDNQLDDKVSNEFEKNSSESDNEFILEGTEEESRIKDTRESRTKDTRENRAKDTQENRAKDTQENRVKDTQENRTPITPITSSIPSNDIGVLQKRVAPKLIPK